MPKLDPIDPTLDLGADPEATRALFTLPATLNARYRLTELVGAGGMGAVYRATDLVSGNEVALKVLHARAVSALSLAMFKAEFMTLAMLSHPNVARVYDFARRHDSAEYFFTMELLAGETALAATRDATLERILDLTVQVLRALSYLHARGVIHSDIKPTNIMVTTAGEARLVDFGIARSAHSVELGRYGTPIYLAPEARGGSAHIDRRADLYSLGVTLFELVFRRPPEGLRAAGPTLSNSAPYARIGSANSRELARLPPWLRAVLERLMEPEPSKRFRTANEVILAIARGRGVVHALETHVTSDSYVASAALVGRAGAFDFLLDHVQSRRLGRGPSVALCRGPSGSGKSRLLRELRNRCQLERFLVLDGRCYDERSDAYSGLSDIVLQAASALKDNADAHRAVIAQLAAGPERPRARRPAPDDFLNVAHLAEEIGEMLAAVNEPCVIVLEDAHWMDSSSLDLLELVIERIGQREPSPPVAFVLGCQDTLPPRMEALVSRLRSARCLVEVSLAPLDAEQVGELVESMLGTTNMTPALASALSESTQGNAFWIAEVLRAWIRDGRLRPDIDGWQFLAFPRASTISKELDHLLRDRLQELTGLSTRVLATLAVVGAPLELDGLESVVGADSEAVLEALLELKQRQMIVLSSDDLVCVSNSHWRSAALGVLSPDAAAELHSGLAVFFSRFDAARAASHYRRAGQLSEAAHEYERAAVQAFESGASRSVFEHVESASACGASAESLGRLWSLAAEAARRCGDGRAASYAERALAASKPNSTEWLRASRVAIASWNTFVKRP